jgi:hypothetical protein
MAVGLRCPTAEATVLADGLGYCYIETTAPTRIGIKPPLINDVPFEEKPVVIPVADGKVFNRITSLNASRGEETQLYGDYILQLVSCQEINLYKDILDREGGLADYEERMNQLVEQVNIAEDEYYKEVKVAEDMGCKGTVSHSLYKKCQDQIEKVNLNVAIYNQRVEEFNQLNEEYQDYYQGYQLVFDSFDALIKENYQGCSNISPETLSIQTPAAEGE